MLVEEGQCTEASFLGNVLYYWVGGRAVYYKKNCILTADVHTAILHITYDTRIIFLYFRPNYYFYNPVRDVTTILLLF